MEPSIGGGWKTFATACVMVQREMRFRLMPLGECQSEMAVLLGLSKAGYGHYERGTNAFTVDQLFTLARILGRSVEHLLGLDSQPEDARVDELVTFFMGVPEEDRARLLRMFRAMVGDE